MGQQQLLLLLATAIIVGLAILLGMNMFVENARAAQRDQVRQGVVDIVGRAQAWYRGPLRNGGGGGSFTGFDLDRIYFDSSSSRGNFSVSQVTANSFRLTGSVPGDGGWSLVLDITPDSLTLVQ